jgi:threonine synthase
MSVDHHAAVLDAGVAHCAVCGWVLDASSMSPWRCINGDDRRHVLHRHRVLEPLQPNGFDHPLLRWDHELLWSAMVDAHGFDLAQRVELVHWLDERLVAIGSEPFRPVRVHRSAELDALLGFTGEGGVFIADTTHEPGQSQKARHLVSALLWLLAMERIDLSRPRARLAIASCGNAAIAASTLASAVNWPIDVFVPEWAGGHIVDTLNSLGANVTRCPRLDSDPAGDPCVFRFREAVDAGAIPFSVQGPENLFALDGGRTLAWEVLDQIGDTTSAWFTQVGGGAFTTSIGFGLADADAHPRLFATQAVGCAPLMHAWAMTQSVGVDEVASRWSEAMTPWLDPTSAATGILDDETYDWHGVVHSLQRSGGDVVIASEAHIAEANRLVNDIVGITSDATATAAMAGLLAYRAHIANTEKVVVWVTGTRRS